MRKIFYLIFLLVTSDFAISQPILTLEEAVRMALKNNFSIQIKKNEVEMSKNNYSLGNAGFLPRIDLIGSYNSSINNTNLEFFDGRVTERTGAVSGSLNTGLSLNWMLFDGFAMFANYDKLYELKTLSKLVLKSEIENVLANLFKTYYSIVSQKSIVKISEESLSISRQRMNLISLKSQVGTASELEALQSRVDFNEDSSNYLNQKEIFKSFLIQLNNLIARNPEIEYDVVDSISLDNIKINNLKFEDIINNNTSIQISEKNITLSEYDYKLIRSTFLPSLNFYSNLGYLNSYSDAGILKSNTQSGYSLGLNLSFNLFNGFRQSNELENIKIITENNKLGHRQVIESIQSLFTLNISYYKKYQNLIELENENLQVARQNLNIAIERLNQGVSTPLEFREAQQKYFQANNRLINAKYLAKLYETDLMKIAGIFIFDY